MPGMVGRQEASKFGWAVSRRDQTMAQNPHPRVGDKPAKWIDKRFGVRLGLLR